MRTRIIHTALLMAACYSPLCLGVDLPQPLTLEYALSLADGPHPRLHQADARLQAAQAEQDRVDAIDGIRVDVELAARYIEPSDLGAAAYPSHNDSFARLSVSKRLYDFGYSRDLDTAAKAELRQRSLDLLEVRQQRRIDIMSRFFQVLLADLEQSRDNEAMAIAFVRMDRARTRHELGQLNDVRLLELESRYQEMLRQQRTSQAKQRASRSRLALTLGHVDKLPADLVFPDLPDLQREPGEVAELVDRALQDNLELRALREAVLAAKKRTEAVYAGNGAVLSGELDATAYNRPLGGDDPLELGLVLEIPIFTGGQRDARAARQRALFQEARAKLSMRELEVRQTVLDLWLELQTLEARRKELQALGEYRELDFDRSRSLYELEAAADLGDAMTKMSVVRLLQAENDFNRVLTWARLDALTGHLIGSTLEHAQ